MQILDRDHLQAVTTAASAAWSLGISNPTLSSAFANSDGQNSFDRAHSTCWVFATARSKHRNPPNLYTFRDYGTTRPLLRPSENTSAKSGSTDLCP